ncbi:MAG: hypothetical protein EXS52_01610 [Candidatus Staskawiczbacteria bacterium]|nr:hypothetical protein [Candidatus Staskawiczbacteria bacterium]
MNESDQNQTLWMVVGIIGLTAIVFLPIIFWDYINPAPKKTNREVAMTCTTDMATEFHIHPNLQIIINGQPQEIPVDIGIVDGCMNALHTHDNTGKMHVESPEKRDFQLSDFFAVWNKAYTKDQVLDYKADATHVIRQTVNGKETQDFENTVLYDEDQIVISYSDASKVGSAGLPVSEEIKPAR